MNALGFRNDVFIVDGFVLERVVPKRDEDNEFFLIGSFEGL